MNRKRTSIALRALVVGALVSVGMGTGILLLFVSCNGETSTHPSPKLEGVWDIMGYTDHGVSGATTGSCTFRDDGTYVILGTVTSDHRIDLTYTPSQVYSGRG